MSKIDTSVKDRVEEFKPGMYVVFYQGKYYNYFTTKAGAEAYLEMLKNGEGFVNRDKTEIVSEVHGVLQGSGSEGGNKSGQSKSTGVLHCEGVQDCPDGGSTPDSYSI